MNIKKLSDDVSVSPQLSVEDCTEILKMGFKSIICNRPDGECETQPSFSCINEQAHELGILTYYLPVISGAITEENRQEFEFALSNLPKPIIAYCRTGTRSGILYSMVSANNEGERS
jgi:sulfide:quinone oxidoreductase